MVLKYSISIKHYTCHFFTHRTSFLKFILQNSTKKRSKKKVGMLFLKTFQPIEMTSIYEGMKIKKKGLSMRLNINNGPYKQTVGFVCTKRAQ